MKKIILAACALAMLLPGAAAAQDEQAGRASQAAHRASLETRGKFRWSLSG